MSRMLAVKSLASILSLFGIHNQRQIDTNNDLNLMLLVSFGSVLLFMTLLYLLTLLSFLQAKIDYRA